VTFYRYRDRKELLEKAKAVFYEAQAEYELQVAQAERSQQQQELCNILYDKVNTTFIVCVEILAVGVADAWYYFVYHLH